MREPHWVFLLDSATLAVRGRLEGHVMQVARVAFQPDGKTVVSSGHDGTVRTWDVATRQQRLLLDSFQGNVRGLAVAPDGKRIFTGELGRRATGTVQAWDAGDGHLLGAPDKYNPGIEDVAISPDGATLASTSRDRSVRLWDATTLAPRGRFEGDGAFASELAFTPDGKGLVTTWSDGTIRLLDVATMRPKYQMAGAAKGFLYLAMAPDGATVATSDGSRLEVRRLADGNLLAAVTDLGGRVNALRFAPDGRSLVVVGLNGFVRVFRIDRPAR